MAIGVGPLQWGEIGLISEYHLGQWDFRAKEQGGGQWMENDEEETGRVRGDSC